MKQNKNKNKIFILLTIFVILTGSLVFVLNGNLNRLKKLKSSVIDPVTGDTCDEGSDGGPVKAGEIDYRYTYNSGSYNGTGRVEGYDVSEAIEDLYRLSKNRCKMGYACENKPSLPVDSEESTCTTLPSADIIKTAFSFSGSETYNPGTVENAIKQIRQLYYSESFCPQKYCVPITYSINLDSKGALQPGTPKIYEKYDTAIYLDVNESIEMTSNDNPITIPRRKYYTISYDSNNSGATFDSTQSTVEADFEGYYLQDRDAEDYYSYYSKKLIDKNGYITSEFKNNLYHVEGSTMYAQYEEEAVTLPEISKTDYSCLWADKSINSFDNCGYNSDEAITVNCYNGGETIEVPGDQVLYGLCESKPTVTVKYYLCDEGGNNCSEDKNKRETVRVERKINCEYWDDEYYVHFPPIDIEGYTKPSGMRRWLCDKQDQVISYYYTREYSYPSYGQGKNNSNYIVSQNSAGTAMTITSNGLSNANYVAIWSSAAAGQDDKYVVPVGTNNFNFNHFTISGNHSDGVGYGAPSNGKYGIYYASFLARENDTTSWTEVSDGNQGNIQIRPYIRVIFKNGTKTVSTQYKTLGSTITTPAAPDKYDYIFRAWQAYTQTSNSTGVSNQSYQACTQNNKYVYYPANYKINANSWNLYNASYPCPSIWGFVDNYETVYMEPVWQKKPWQGSSYN